MNLCATRGSISPLVYPQLLATKEVTSRQTVGLRPLKNKGFKEERMTKVGGYAIDTSTTLESNKSLLGMTDSLDEAA